MLHTHAGYGVRRLHVHDLLHQNTTVYSGIAWCHGGLKRARLLTVVYQTVCQLSALPRGERHGGADQTAPTVPAPPRPAPAPAPPRPFCWRDHAQQAKESIHSRLPVQLYLYDPVMVETQYGENRHTSTNVLPYNFGLRRQLRTC